MLTKKLVLGAMTIRIDEGLQARISAAADQAGMTTHAFILHAIERSVEQLEQVQQDEFHQLADARWARLLETGRTVSWDEAKSHVVGRAR